MVFKKNRIIGLSQTVSTSLSFWFATRRDGQTRGSLSRWSGDELELKQFTSKTFKRSSKQVEPTLELKGRKSERKGERGGRDFPQNRLGRELLFIFPQRKRALLSFFSLSSRSKRRTQVPKLGFRCGRPRTKTIGMASQLTNNGLEPNSDGLPTY